MKFAPPQSMSEIEQLRLECAERARFYGLIWNGLNITANRFYGEAFSIELVRSSLLGEQNERFQASVRKLGLENEPPALKAAKYHYLSNQIGGIESQIIVENDRKAWLRHPSPQSAWPGLSFLALPSRVRREGFITWHPRDGALMGCPRLRWVVTKVRAEGEAYEEGYFEEMDRPLGPDEVLAFENPEHTPEFDPDRAPQLDPDVWPEERLLKARRNYIRDYARQTLVSIERLQGPREASRTLETCLQGIAHQFTHELMRDLGLSHDSLDDLTRTLSAFLWLAEVPHEVVETEANVRRFSVLGGAADPHPVLGRHSRSLRVWLDLVVRILNGRMALEEVGADRAAQVWDLVDFGRWIR